MSAIDVVIDLSADAESKFGLYASGHYELTFGGLTVIMTADQFQQHCDNLKPWVVEGSV